jgi:predicted RNA-binding Zn-ribbon protein involved in translation (DUF1610 family)
MDIQNTPIYQHIQDVLDKRFDDPEKRKIHIHENRLNFACPYCGDSKKSNRTKRGNLYLNSLKYVCFNYGDCIVAESHKYIDNMFKDFGLALDASEKLDIYNHIDQYLSFKQASDEYVQTKLGDLISLDDLVAHFDKLDSTLRYLTRVQPNDAVGKYLLGRGIKEETWGNIYQARRYFKNGKYIPVLVFINGSKDRVLSMQTREIFGSNRNYIVYNYEMVYKMVYPEKFEELSVAKRATYNKLSYYFNVLNVNFSKTVTVFEGYLDSLFYPNSIGIVGVNTDTTFLEDSGAAINYFFDNDGAGYRKTEQKMKKGFPCFLWLKLMEKLIEKHKPKDVTEFERFFMKLKDLNLLALDTPEPYSTLKLYEFMSEDKYDLMYVPLIKPQKKQWKKTTA